MKKLMGLIAIVMLLLSACGSQEGFETITIDGYRRKWKKGIRY